MPETIADVVLRMAQQYLASEAGIDSSAASEVQLVEGMDEPQRRLPPLARGGQWGSDELSLRRPIPVVPDPNPGSDASNLNSQLIEPQNPDAPQAHVVPDEARRASSNAPVQGTIESSTAQADDG